MSRNLTRILMAVLVLNGIAVASTLLPNTAHSTANDAGVATANDVSTVAANNAAAADFAFIVSTVTAAPYHISAPAAAAVVDFDKTFASVSTSHPMNTPPNRERLRNIGWRRILGS
jgi:hypothetical protein